MTRTGVLRVADSDATEALGSSIAAILRPGDVVALSGPLGVGKTTLARGILTAMGLADEAPSPSFSIVIAYDRPDVRIPVWHVDLYRIGNADEIIELGLDDARTDAILLIEWPERMGGQLWDDALRLVLEPDPNGGRRLTWNAPAAWDTRWPLQQS